MKKTDKQITEYPSREKMELLIIKKREINDSLEKIDELNNILLKAATAPKTEYGELNSANNSLLKNEIEKISNSFSIKENFGLEINEHIENLQILLHTIDNGINLKETEIMKHILTKDAKIIRFDMKAEKEKSFRTSL